MDTFEELEAWKSARELRKAISKMVKVFPGDERFRLIYFDTNFTNFINRVNHQLWCYLIRLCYVQRGYAEQLEKMFTRLNERIVLFNLLPDGSPLFREEYNSGVLSKERNVFSFSIEYTI